MQDSHARLALVEARLQQIEQEGKPPPYEVTTKSAEEMVIASVRQIVPKPEEMDYYCKQRFKKKRCWNSRFRFQFNSLLTVKSEPS